MSDLHIDEFYVDAGRIVTTLYQVFPRPIELFVEDISGPDEPDEYGVHSNRHQACFGAMLWLAEEGYLRYTETVRREAIDQAVLSAACFSELVRIRPDQVDEELPPSVAAERGTLAFRLSESIRTRDKTATAQAFRELLIAMAD